MTDSPYSEGYPKTPDQLSPADPLVVPLSDAERLRKEVDLMHGRTSDAIAAKNAAENREAQLRKERDEVFTQLSAEIERLREALERIAAKGDYVVDGTIVVVESREAEECAAIARAALNPERGERVEIDGESILIYPEEDCCAWCQLRIKHLESQLRAVWERIKTLKNLQGGEENSITYMADDLLSLFSPDTPERGE